MKYDERTCKFNMDTGCVELLLRDGRKISIDCTGVEDALDVTMAQRSELDYLIYNDPLSYADLILNGNPEEYLKNVMPLWSQLSSMLAEFSFDGSSTW